MNRGRTWRHTLTIAAAACLAATVAAAPASSQAAGSSSGAAADRPDLSLRVASKAVTAHKSGDHKVFLDLGAYLVAGDVPFQVNSTRASYRKPVVGTVIGDPDDPADDITLTQDMVSGFNGLRDFVHLRIRDTDGRIVGEQTKGFCAAAGAVRVRPNAPDTSDFPNSDFYGGCRYHPFTLGSVLGLQEGWGASVLGYGSRMELARGRYDVTVTIDKDYRELLGISAEDGQAALRLRVVKGEDHCEGASGCAEQPRSTGVVARSRGRTLPRTTPRCPPTATSPTCGRCRRPASGCATATSPSARRSGTPAPRRWSSTASASGTRTS